MELYLALWMPTAKERYMPLKTSLSQKAIVVCTSSYENTKQVYQSGFYNFI
jgi:hypothetical protein